jgi:serine/threonine protein phosphatase 1
MFRLFGRRADPAVRSSTRIALSEQPAVIYAIGDIHGCLDKLKRLEASIAADAAAIEGDKLIITLGDYVDRGPSSAQTLRWLTSAPPAGFQRICLRGNHEVMFLQALSDPRSAVDWLRWGGRETLASYGIDADSFLSMSSKTRQQVLESFVPEEHRTFLRDCPVMVSVGQWVFVHAGIRPGVSLAQQRDEDLFWIREPFLNKPHGLPQTVVHGHTPVEQPEVAPGRIGIDTGAFAGGPLTALRISSTGERAFLSA